MKTKEWIPVWVVQCRDQNPRRILRDSGVKTIRTLPMAPHLNPIVERFVRSIIDV